MLGWARLDTSLLSDPKVVALARAQKDPAKTAATVALYVGAVLASWREDRPVSVAEAAPAWWLDDVSAYVADLRAAGLVDRHGKVPRATLDRWMQKVRAQRAAGRSTAAGRWGADSKQGSKRVGSVKHADATDRQTDKETYRERHSSSPDAPRARTGARGAQMVQFGDAMVAAGLDPAAVGKSPKTT
jgi:hypothetical protein